MSNKKEKKVCSICGLEYKGYGNDAEPINSGRCCDTCNNMKVIPARISNLNNKNKNV